MPAEEWHGSLAEAAHAQGAEFAFSLCGLPRSEETRTSSSLSLSSVLDPSSLTFVTQCEMQENGTCRRCASRAIACVRPVSTRSNLIRERTYERWQQQQQQQEEQEQE